MTTAKEIRSLGDLENHLFHHAAQSKRRIQRRSVVQLDCGYKNRGLVSCYLPPDGYLRFMMARPLRVEFDGALYHVTSRGHAREDIFDEDRDGEPTNCPGGASLPKHMSLFQQPTNELGRS